MNGLVCIFFVFFVFFFPFFSASFTVHGTWTVHLGLWTVTRTVHARRLHCAGDIVHYSRTIYVLFTGPTITLFRKKNIKNGPHGTVCTFKKKENSTVFSVFNKISCIQTDPNYLQIAIEVSWELKISYQLTYMSL